jgi:hypothetical protein
VGLVKVRHVATAQSISNEIATVFVDNASLEDNTALGPPVAEKQQIDIEHYAQTICRHSWQGLLWKHVLLVVLFSISESLILSLSLSISPSISAHKSQNYRW